jgi:hypothetical protein
MKGRILTPRAIQEPKGTNRMVLVIKNIYVVFVGEDCFLSRNKTVSKDELIYFKALEGLTRRHATLLGLLPPSRALLWAAWRVAAYKRLLGLLVHTN